MKAKIEKLELLLNQETISLKKNTINFLDVLVSFVTIFGLGLFWAWCSGNNDSNMMKKEVLGIPTFYFILVIFIPLFLIVIGIYIFIKYKNVKDLLKKQHLMSSLYWNNLLGFYIFEKIGITRKKFDTIENAINKYRKVNKKVFNSVTINKSEFYNYLLELYKPYDIDTSLEFFTNLSEYCILLNISNKVVYQFKGNQYKLNIFNCKKELLRSLFLMYNKEYY